MNNDCLLIVLAVGCKLIVCVVVDGSNDSNYEFEYMLFLSTVDHTNHLNLYLEMKCNESQPGSKTCILFEP